METPSEFYREEIVFFFFFFFFVGGGGWFDWVGATNLDGTVLFSYLFEFWFGLQGGRFGSGRVTSGLLFLSFLCSTGP
jgi:hypothetical protein